MELSPSPSAGRGDARHGAEGCFPPRLLRPSANVDALPARNATPGPSTSASSGCSERGAPLVALSPAGRRLLNHPPAACGGEREQPATELLVSKRFGTLDHLATTMKPRPLVCVAAGAAGWAWRPRPRARSPGVSPKCSQAAATAAAEGAVHSEHHPRRRGVRGVLFRPVGLPRTEQAWKLEERIEKVIYACRFMTFLGIGGLLAGSIPCFLKGWVYVMDAFVKYYLHGGGTVSVILMLVEAIDMFLIGTVMFVFGTGLYELFISNMDMSYGSNLFGLFSLPERPKWLVIQSVNDLKTKLGHVIVMVLLVGIFEKSMTVTITSCADLLCFAASIFISSGCLYLLSKLNI
ncbi:hypothetical protein PAHAL_4G019100 [Panicum hallii]|uniref:Uncharacterized protein n=1 Tax=Panicum hallii TaxID=206008 RepID=A0A2T8JBI8_9POAL|nr:uncharacterized protein LOC112889068 [Panicum hallii]PVH47261.1 hypothetical protein PAHAL_4G019100 [Panicum hallii]